ncbi:Ig-like domain-containing protein [Pelagibacteraceae bacterium]|nr:Ig-like domain-containing protein [Pelagibacteraceae bacterium]
MKKLINNYSVSFLKKILIIFKINLLVITLFTSSAQAQVISVSTSSTVTINSNEDFVVNSGVTLSNTTSTANAGSSGSSIALNNFTNNGTMQGSDTGGNIMSAFNSSVKTTFINNGVMRGKDGINFYSSVDLTNNASKSIQGNDRAIHFLSGSTGTDLTNNGSIQGNYSSIKVYSGTTINSLTNGSTGTIGGTGCNNIIGIELLGTITTLTNNGSIRNCRSDIAAINGSSATITTLKNYGTINNSNSSKSIAGTTVTNLHNSQSNFKFSGNLPSNYYIFIDGSNTGKITFSSFGSTSLVFGIDPTSTLSTGTYSAVVNGISSSNISSGTSGTFGGKNWVLTNSSGTQWDLVVTDTTNPTLSSTSPADDATNVIKDGTIVLNFSENVVVGSGNITIKIASSDVSIETIEVNNPEVTGSGTSQITINPQTNWGQNTEYYVLIDGTAFDDASGNSYAGISSKTALTFTVANDTPISTSSVPANNATSVALDANIVLNFSENVTAQSGNITIYETDGSTVETISVTDTDKVSGSGSSQITINPSSSFDSTDTGYYVLIAGSAFDDADGGSYAGISSTTALTFTSSAYALPTLSSSTPADNASNVARDANIVLNFSENVTAQSGNITIKKADNTIFETISVADTTKVTGTGTNQITINPSSDFVLNTDYYVLIDGTAFDDANSVSYAGIGSTTALSFSVESMVDPTTDKDTTGSIDAQSSQIQSTFIKSISTVSTRLSYLRQNRSNDNFAKNNIKLEGGNVMLTSLVKAISSSSTASPKLNLTKLIPDNWSPWSEGSISLLKIKNNSSEIESQSLAFGFDRKLNNNNLLGFAIQYGQSDTDVGTNGTGIDSKNYNLSLYQTRPLNDDNFIEGLIGVGIIEKDLTRKSGSNTLTGSRDGAQIFGSINYGKTIDKGDFNLTPIARVDLGYTELDAYTETGTDALSYDKQTVESGRVSLGLEFNDIIKFSNSSFKPFGLVEYGLDFSNSSDVQMNYVSDTSTTYTYTQTVNSTHLLTSEVGFNYEALENLNIKTSYKRIQGNENEHIDTVKFAFKFKSRRETEYAMSLDGNEDFKTGFDITKNINGLNLNFNANQSFNETFDREAKVSLSSVF